MFNHRRTLLSLGLLCGLLATAASATPIVFYVTNADNNTVSLVDEFGNANHSFIDSTHLLNPMGIATDTLGNIYVASNGTDSIEAYDSSGVHTGSISFGAVTALSVDLLGNIVAISTNDGLIKKFATNGTELASATIDTPLALTLDDSGNVYVTQNDSTNGYQVVKLNAALDPPTVLVTGNLNETLGLVFRANTLYATSLFDQTIERFDATTGAHLTPVWGDPLLDFAKGLIFSPTGDLYVANGNTNEVLRFSASGTPLGAFAAGFANPTGLAFSAVPEPATYATVGIALLALGLLRRKRT